MRAELGLILALCCGGAACFLVLLPQEDQAAEVSTDTRHEGWVSKAEHTGSWWDLADAMRDMNQSCFPHLCCCCAAARVG